jgi:hypothetical protein
MTGLEQTIDKVASLMALVQSAEQELASSRDDLERLVDEAQEALGTGAAAEAVACARQGPSAELVQFWAGVSAQLDTEVERLTTSQRDVLVLVDATLMRTREENDAGNALDAQPQPGVWGSSWKPPVLASPPIEEEPDGQSLTPPGRQRLSRILLMLGSTLIVAALLLLVV